MLPAISLDAISRELARRDLNEYQVYLNPDQPPARHSRLLNDKLMAVERGEITRLMVFMPPGHAKSHYATVNFPSWFLGRNPRQSIISCSYNDDLASAFGRRVRNIVASTDYQSVFNIGLAQDSRAVDNWAIEFAGKRPGQQAGEYRAAGVGGGITGRRGDVGVIDDPIKGREEADSATIRRKQWDWYINDFRTRLKPDNRIVIVMCMTGDTPVLMENGQEKPLRDIRPGDRVATFDEGKVSVSTVRNWKNNGLDLVYEIRMKSGIVVRANARHPFLVDEGGELKWQRTATLKKGSVILKVTGASGKASHAQSKGAPSQQNAEACACRTTTSIDGIQGFARPRSTLKPGVRRVCATAMELVSKSTAAFFQNRAAFVRSVSNPQQSKTRAPIGTTSFVSIIATIAKRLEDFFVMTATLQLAMERQRKNFSPPLSTYEVTRDTVLEIVESGVEDVFDVQVDRTENFIANGLVSHNTRWHEDDLSGRILPEKYDGRSGWFTARDGERWYVLSLQAIAEDGIQCPLGRRPGEALWPEYYSLDFLLQQKATLSTKDTRAWTSLYQQRPAPESGGYFQRSWFKTYSTLPDKVLYVMTSDYAVTDGGGDKTEHAVWAIDQPNNIYAVDWWSGRTTMDVWIDVQLDLAAKWGIALAVGESGVIKKAAEPYLLRRMAERNLFFRMEWLASVSDKPARARGFQARASAGMVYLPDNKPWVADLLDEALTFPAGVYDDKVDCCGLLGRALDMTGFVRSAEKAKRQPIKKFTPAWLEYEPPKQKGRYL